MDDSTETFLEKLEEFIYDEDKTVTYTWLSTNLNIKVNEAKDLLEKYVQKVRRTKLNDLSITYLVVGTKNGSNFSIILSKESDLEENRSAFDHISSQHVYSIQKSKVADASVLFLVEALSVHNLREKPILGSVVGKNCVKRVLRRKNIPVPEKNVQGKYLTFGKKVQSAGEVDNISKNGGTSEIFNKANQKQNGITSFFTKVQSEGDIKDQKYINKTTKPKTNGIMGSFLSKGSVKTNSEQNTCIKSEIEVVTDNKIEDDKAKTNEIEAKIVNKKESNKFKRPRKNNKSAQAQKKRKRIIERHDSDSDDIFGDDENPEFEETESRKRRLSSPNETGDATDEEPSPVYESLSKPVNKKRKQVMRTFTDEDGYMITKNEWVFEEESGDEEKENSRNKVQQDVEIVGNSAAEINLLKKPSEMEICIEDESNKESKLLISKKDSTEELPPSKVAKKKPGKSDKKSRNQQTLLNFFKKT